MNAPPALTMPIHHSVRAARAQPGILSSQLVPSAGERDYKSGARSESSLVIWQAFMLKRRSHPRRTLALLPLHPGSHSLRQQLLGLWTAFETPVNRAHSERSGERKEGWPMLFPWVAVGLFLGLSTIAIAVAAHNR